MQNFNFYTFTDNQHLMIRPSRSPPCPLPISPFKNPMPQSTALTPKGAKMSAEKSKCSLSEDQKKRKMSKKRKSLESKDLEDSCAKTDKVSNLSLNTDCPVDNFLERENNSKTPDVWEILGLSWALPELLSPLPPDELVIIYK